MSYLEWIRSRVGNAPILLVYATALIRDDQGRVLFQRRGDFPVWGLPGGILEPGEKIRETLQREVREETGYEVQPGRFVGLYSSPDYTIHYPNTDVVQQVTACFECRIRGGRDRPDGAEALEQEFRPLESAPTLFPWYLQMLIDSEQTAGTRFDGGTARRSNPHTEGILRWLRTRVGQEAIVTPCAAAVVQDQGGRILLMKRGDSGLWSLPSGMMELGERIDQTAVREVEEETGLCVRPIRLTGVYSGKDQWAQYPNGDQAWLVVATFLCEAVSGTLRPDGVESLDAAFFEPEDLPLDHLPWGPRTRRRIADALDYGPTAVAD